MEKKGRARQVTDYNIVRRVRYTYMVTKATNTHSEYVIFIVFPRQQWLLKCASELRNMYIAYLVVIRLRLWKLFVNLWRTSTSGYVKRKYPYWVQYIVSGHELQRNLFIMLSAAYFDLSCFQSLPEFDLKNVWTIIKYFIFMIFIVGGKNEKIIIILRDNVINKGIVWTTQDRQCMLKVTMGLVGITNVAVGKTVCI